MLERAALLSPREGFIVDSLGWAYYLLKDYPKSVIVLENAVALDPGSAVINDHLGDAYWRVGRKREARFQWAKALGLKDDFPDNDRKRVEMKLEKGLDAVGDKIVLPDRKIQREKIRKIEMTAVSVQAPAKVNLYLHVTGRRGDGYHCWTACLFLLRTGTS